MIALVAVPTLQAQFSTLISDSAGAYAVIKKVNHEIQWWAVLLAGAVMISMFRALSWLRPSQMVPMMQRALACLVYSVIGFCIMLIMIQFRDLWLPTVSLMVNYIVGAF